MNYKVCLGTGLHLLTCETTDRKGNFPSGCRRDRLLARRGLLLGGWVTDLERLPTLSLVSNSVLLCDVRVVCRDQYVESSKPPPMLAEVTSTALPGVLKALNSFISIMFNPSERTLEQSNLLFLVPTTLADGVLNFVDDPAVGVYRLPLCTDLLAADLLPVVVDLCLIDTDCGVCGMVLAVACFTDLGVIALMILLMNDWLGVATGVTASSVLRYCHQSLCIPLSMMILVLLMLPPTVTMHAHTYYT